MADFNDDDLEAKLEAEQAKTAALQAQVAEGAEAKAESDKALALAQAGLGHLDEVQRKAILAVHEGDVTGESVLATAQSLGFAAAATGTTGESPPPVGAALGASSTSGAAAPPETPSLEAQLRGTKSQDELLALLQANNYPLDWDGVVGQLERANATVPL